MNEVSYDTEELSCFPDDWYKKHNWYLRN